MIDIIAMTGNKTPIASSVVSAQEAKGFLQDCIRKGAKLFRIANSEGTLHLGVSAVYSLFRLGGNC